MHLDSTIENDAMANLTIRRIDPRVKERLRQQAAVHGHSMEEEARQILSGALAETPASGDTALDWLREPFARIGGVELTLPKRSPGRAAPDFE